jgi:HEPN domain-containing protein
MPPDRFSPDDPREWLNRARSNLAKAQEIPDLEYVYLEDLCFDAQQAAEKAIKAVLIHLNAQFPYTHDLARLLSLAEQAGTEVPDDIKPAVALTEYAVATRYPSPSEPVSMDEYEEAVSLAAMVLTWAQRIVEAGQDS